MKPPTTPREMIAHLQHELSVANNWIEHHQNHVDDLIKENAALRTYKANTTIRITALEKENAMWVQTVDRLLKEAQP